MHPEFSDRFRIVGLEPLAAATFTAWGKGVRAYLKILDEERVLDLVRVCHELPRRPEAPTKFRSTIQKFDASLSASGDHLQVRLLAGSTVTELLREQPGRLATIGALAMVCANARGRQQCTPIAPFVSDAEDYLRERGLEARTLGSLPTLDDNVGFTDSQLDEIASGESGDARRQLAQDINALAEHQAEAVRHLARQLVLVREEANIAWWVLGEHSRDFRRHVAKLPPAAAPVVLGQELAALTAQMPGPIAAEAFLDRMLSRVPSLPSTISLTTAVEAVVELAEEQPNWIVARSSTEGIANVEGLTPVATAVRLALSSRNGAPPAWPALYQKICGDDPTRALEPLALAMQSYEERLLELALRKPAEDDPMWLPDEDT